MENHQITATDSGVHVQADRKMAFRRMVSVMILGGLILYGVLFLDTSQNGNAITSYSTEPSLGLMGRSQTDPMHSIRLLGDDTNAISCADRLQVKYNCTQSACAEVRSGFINYLMVYECTMGNVKPLAWFLIAIWWCFMFYLLAHSADAFFCPALQVLVDSLQLSPNTAGVTFLSFGNGAPDVFSSIAAYSSGASHVGTTAILGAGMFVSTAILGTVVLIGKEVKLKRRPFLRDISAYAIAITYLLINFQMGKLNSLRAGGFMILYIGYATVAIVSHHINQRWKRRRKLATAEYLELSESDEAIGDQEKAEFSKETEQALLTDQEADNVAVNGGKSENGHMTSHLGMPNGDVGNNRRLRVGSEGTGADRVTSKHLSRSEWKHVFADHPPPMLFNESHRRVDNLLSSLQYEPEEEESILKYHRTGGSVDERMFCLNKARLQEGGVKEGSLSERQPADTNTLTDNKEVSALEKYFGRNSWIGNALYYALMPSRIIRMLSVPLVDEGTYDWRYVMWTPLFGFLWLVFTGTKIGGKSPAYFGQNMSSSVAWFPWWFFSIVVGLCGTVILYFVLPRTGAPRGILKGVLTFGAFVSSIAWLINSADEIVALLQTLAKMSGASSSVLGLTLLALGNASSDFAANVSVAKEGLPAMSVAAAHAAPCFNILFGLGVSTLIGIQKAGEDFSLKPDDHGTVRLIQATFGFLLMALAACAIIVPLQGFTMKRPFGIFMILFYVAFFVTIIAIASTN